MTARTGSQTPLPAKAADLVLHPFTSPGNGVEPLLRDGQAGSLAEPVGVRGDLGQRVVDVVDVRPELRAQCQIPLGGRPGGCRPHRTPRRTARPPACAARRAWSPRHRGSRTSLVSFRRSWTRASALHLEELGVVRRLCRLLGCGLLGRDLLHRSGGLLGHRPESATAFLAGASSASWPERPWWVQPSWSCLRHGGLFAGAFSMQPSSWGVPAWRRPSWPELWQESSSPRSWAKRPS